MDPLILVYYALIGVVAGVAAGLLGIGGGLIIIAPLAALYRAQGFSGDILMQLAVGTSLTTIVFTSLSSARAHHRRGAVLWPILGRFIPGVVAGCALGAVIADRVSSRELEIVVGTFAGLAGLRMLVKTNPPPHRRLPGTPVLVAVAVAIGTVSTLVGIGGGLMTVPFLVWSSVPVRHAIGTSAALGFPIAVFGAVGMAAVGWGHPGLPPLATGYVYWPGALSIAAATVLFAPLGAHLAHVLPVRVVTVIFALVLFVISARLIGGGGWEALLA
nr:hypothetical protein [uncultured bacterium]